MAELDIGQGVVAQDDPKDEMVGEFTPFTDDQKRAFAQAYEERNPDVIKDQGSAELIATTINNLNNSVDILAKEAFSLAASLEFDKAETKLSQMRNTKRDVENTIARLERIASSVQKALNGYKIER